MEENDDDSKAAVLACKTKDLACPNSDRENRLLEEYFGKVGFGSSVVTVWNRGVYRLSRRKQMSVSKCECPFVN